jgi:hypothetical protein
MPAWRSALRLRSAESKSRVLLLAEAHCQRALKLDELVGQAWQTLGTIHTEAGRADEALEDSKAPAAAKPRGPPRPPASRLRRQGEAEAHQEGERCFPDSRSLHGTAGSAGANRYRMPGRLRQALSRVPENAALSSLGDAPRAGRLEEAQGSRSGRSNSSRPLRGVNLGPGTTAAATTRGGVRTATGLSPATTGCGGIRRRLRQGAWPADRAPRPGCQASTSPAGA